MNHFSTPPLSSGELHNSGTAGRMTRGIGILGWRRDVQKASQGEGGTAGEVVEQHEDGGASAEDSTGEIESHRPIRPDFTRPATWAHRILPVVRPPARPFKTTALETTATDDPSPPRASPPTSPRRRLPALFHMPSVPRFSSPSKKTSAPTEFPSSPEAKRTPSSHLRTHSSPQATRWPQIDDYTRNASTSTSGNLFFAPPPSAPSSHFNSYPVSHFSDASTSPTTARYSISSSRTPLSSALPSPPIPLQAPVFRTEDHIGFRRQSMYYTTAVERFEAELDEAPEHHNPKRGGVLLAGLPPSFLDLDNPPSPALSIDSFFPSTIPISTASDNFPHHLDAAPPPRPPPVSPEDSVWEEDSDDEDGDERLSSAFTSPPPGMVSRFSDWTPSPPASAFDDDDEHGSGSEGEEAENDNEEHFDLSSLSLDKPRLTLDAGVRKSARSTLHPSPSMPLLPTVAPQRPALISFSTDLAEVRSVSRATYPPATVDEVRAFGGLRTPSATRLVSAK